MASEKRHQYKVHPDYLYLSKDLELIPERFLKGEGELIYDGRNQLRRFEIQGYRFVVKSFKIPHLINKIVYSFFRSSKAQRSYENALLLLGMGIGTPAPVAYFTYRKGVFFSHSFYVSVESECPYTYKSFFSEDFSWMDGALTKIGQVTALLHDNGWMHNDYSRGNLLLARRADGSVILEIVDLNRMRHGKVSMKKGCKNMERLPVTPHMAQVLSQAYARARGFNEQECLKLITYYRSRQKDLIDGKY